VILVSGSSGFIGRRLCAYAAKNGHSIKAAVRSVDSHNISADALIVGDIGPDTDWSSALQGVDVIIHLAARVHVMKEASKYPLAEYRRVNVDETRNLALSAAKEGVKRFVFVSTIKVNGESTHKKPFEEKDPPAPADPYSISKWEAEQALLEVSFRTGLEIVILRPPLVYGPGVKGNLLALMKYVDKGYPLPFGKISNKRSFISLDNLVDALLTSATVPECAGMTFLVSDGHTLSTSDLVKIIARAMNRKTNLINIPEGLFSILGMVVPPLRPVIDRLTGSLVVDSSLFGHVTGWSPVQTVDEGIESMVSEYLRNK